MIVSVVFFVAVEGGGGAFLEPRNPYRPPIYVVTCLACSPPLDSQLFKIVQVFWGPMPKPLNAQPSFLNPKPHMSHSLNSWLLVSPLNPLLNLPLRSLDYSSYMVVAQNRGTLL